MNNCRTEDDKCIDHNKGQKGMCRGCELNSHLVSVTFDIHPAEKHFLAELCQIDGTPMTTALRELVSQGVRSLRRHVGEVG